MVTSNSGPVNPPSLLLLAELPISIGPSMGPDPKKCDMFGNYYFPAKMPAAGRRLPSDAMVSRCLDLKAFHTSLSELSCS